MDGRTDEVASATVADERDVVVFRGRINGINLSGSFGFGAARASPLCPPL